MKVIINSKTPARTKIVSTLCDALDGKINEVFIPAGYHVRIEQAVQNSPKHYVMTTQEALEEIYYAYALDKWLKANVTEQTTEKPTFFELASTAAAMGWKVEANRQPWDGIKEHLSWQNTIYIANLGRLQAEQVGTQYRLVAIMGSSTGIVLSTEKTPADVFLKTLTRLPEIRQQLLEQEELRLLKNELGKYAMKAVISSGAVDAQLREILGITASTHFHVTANKELWYYTKSENLYGFRLNPENFFVEATKAIAFGKRLEDLLVQHTDGTPRPFTCQFFNIPGEGQFGHHLCLPTGLLDDLHVAIEIASTPDCIDRNFLTEAKLLLDDIQELTETAGKEDADIILPAFIQLARWNMDLNGIATRRFRGLN